MIHSYLEKLEYKFVFFYNQIRIYTHRHIIKVIIKYLAFIPPFKLISSKLVDFLCCCCISRLNWVWDWGLWWCPCWLWSGGLAELAVLKDSDLGVISSWGNPESTDLLLLGVWSSWNEKSFIITWKERLLLHTSNSITIV